MRFDREKIERLIAQRGFKISDLEGRCGFSESGAVHTNRKQQGNWPLMRKRLYKEKP